MIGVNHSPESDENVVVWTWRRWKRNCVARVRCWWVERRGTHVEPGAIGERRAVVTIALNRIGSSEDMYDQ